MNIYFCLNCHRSAGAQKNLLAKVCGSSLSLEGAAGFEGIPIVYCLPQSLVPLGFSDNGGATPPQAPRTNRDEDLVTLQMFALQLPISPSGLTSIASGQG